jgi:hypothetical protein
MQMGPKIKLFIVFGLIVLMGICLAREARLMAPIKEGNSSGFWFYACRVKLDGDQQEGSFGGIYQPQDGWFIYYLQGFHGQRLFRVEPSEALADFPVVVEKLHHAPPDTLPPFVENGFQEWVRADPTQSDAAALLEKLRDAKFDYMRPVHPEGVEYLQWEQSDFAERWQRARRYPLNWIVEFLFFTGLILWSAWPWLRRSGPLAWGIHFGLSPVLFFLPYVLGYARLTFTSTGPSGGVLYPWLLLGFSDVPWTRLDTSIMGHIPQILEPLNQSAGPMWVLSVHGGVGPVAVLAMGTLLGLAAWFIRLRVNRLATARSLERG